MVSNFLENRIKAKIIIFFLQHQERAFYIRELESVLHSKSLNPHLNDLVKAGFLKSFVKKGSRFYMLNTKSALIADFKSIISKQRIKSRPIFDPLEKAILKVKGLKVAVLSGLFVGNLNADCDLLLAGSVSQRSLDNLVSKIEVMVGQEINYALFSSSEYQYRKNIFDRFMKDVFDNRHAVILEKIG